MPASYRLDPARRLVLTHSSGVLTDREVRDVYEAIRKDPAFEPTFQQLCDLRDVTEITATVETLRDLARSHIFAAGTRRAFVVARDVDYGMSRLFQAYALEGAVLEVFRDIEKAEMWLGLRASRPA
jgi:hypothetical protein